MPSLALRSLWEGPPFIPPTPPPVTTSGGGGAQDRRRRSRVLLEQHLITLWAAGEITDEELARLLKG